MSMSYPGFLYPFRPSPEEVLQWRDSLEKLLQNPCKSPSVTVSPPQPVSPWWAVGIQGAPVLSSA